jgi:dTDP-4-dehydrorhamnose reductase
MVLKNILLTGGSGILGTELKKLEEDLLTPSSRELDITDSFSVKNFFKNNKIDLVIHAAAYTNVSLAEKEFEKTIDVNIIGTHNILKNCIERNIKLVYISTDYVFDGEKGNYTTEDPINPITKYAKSKAAAELMIRIYDNSHCIRTSFYGHEFPYDKALVDQFTTKDYIDIMAPKILDLCLSEKIGVSHCHSEKRSVYELAKQRKENVVKIERKNLKNKIPYDISLV